jgi:gluconokinase
MSRQGLITRIALSGTGGQAGGLLLQAHCLPGKSASRWSPLFSTLLDSAILMMHSVVVMGVSGCGKSSLGHALAGALGARFVEGDAHHSEENLRKMRSGIALTDEDRDGWLAALAAELQQAPPPVVLTCSALKRRYRDRLRSASAGLRFVFMDIDRDQALQRVASRGAAHFFSTSLVDNQFATLERPEGEPGVLRVDATAALPALTAQVIAWLAPEENE